MVDFLYTLFIFSVSIVICLQYRAVKNLSNVVGIINRHLKTMDAAIDYSREQIVYLRQKYHNISEKNNE